VSDEFRSVRAELPLQVEELVAKFRSPFTQIEFLRLLVDGGVLEPVLVDAATATRMVHPYNWLLDRVGAEGIKLTSAGYLPPVHVEAIVAELGLAEEWIGSYNRESQTLPALEFRESAMRLGLLRKYQGKLLPTTRGRKLRDDPVALWWHLAQSVPPLKAAPLVRHASLLLLAAVAGQAAASRTDIGRADGDPHEYVAHMLWEAGWARRDGTEPDKWEAGRATDDTYTVLVRLDALVPDWHGSNPDRPTANGALFARAALRTWPPRLVVWPVSSPGVHNGRVAR
jgi:hypothetical protein